MTTCPYDWHHLLVTTQHNGSDQVLVSKSEVDENEEITTIILNDMSDEKYNQAVDLFGSWLQSFDEYHCVVFSRFSLYNITKEQIIFINENLGATL